MKLAPALEIIHLSVNYEKTPILWDISLRVPSGNIVGIIGPNGAGKSTLLKTILGLIKPVSGKVEFFGSTLAEMQKRIAYVPQRESVDWDFPITVKELVMMGRYGALGVFQRPKKQDYADAQKYLELVGMKGFENRQISQLSGGQQQRVFIARALLQEADIYFMDEPFSGIDMGSESMIIHLLKELKNKGKTIFVVHHDLNTIESYFDWLIMLNMRLVTCGPVREVFNSMTLQSTYGKNYALFDDALKLSQSKNVGIHL